MSNEDLRERQSSLFSLFSPSLPKNAFVSFLYAHAYPYYLLADNKSVRLGKKKIN